MPMPSEMGYQIAAPEKAAIINALNTALNTLNAIKIVQLTAKERKTVQTASEKRMPYIEHAINTLAPQFPNLQPGFLSIADARNDLETAATLREINVLIKEISDRYTDFSLASEHFAYQYMRKFYAMAKEAQPINTPGADTVLSELGPLFEKHGPKNQPLSNP